VCGICGVLDFRGRDLDPAVLERMNASLRHRGPDDAGTFAEGPVMLGHRRLAIIDLSPTGHQPMASDDGSVVIVYNGETYNFPELRRELASLGHVFRGTSDTEVVLAAYREWGEASFARLNGMFALAIWDARQRRLLLARDRFGIKPLFYRWRDGRLVFGSEIKAILEHGGPRELNWAFLHEYLYYGNSLWQESAFAGIHKVLPGHFLRFDANGMTQRAYWRVEDLEERSGSFEELRERTRELLERAVVRHLIADVPVAVFLSGGIDSSAVTVLAARHYAGKLKTFSVGFDFSPSDERPVAKRLAAEVGTEHHEIFVTTDHLEEVIESLVRSHDEPFADAANVPLVLLCRQLRGMGVKVALQGDGGDEIFAGYRRYNVLSHEWLWRLLAKPGLAASAALPDAPAKFRLQRFLHAMADRDPVVRLALLMTVEDRESRPERILSAEARREIQGTDALRAYRDVAGALRGRDPVQRSLLVDLKLLLPDQFLPKVDRATMSESIETRVPFLDAELADWVIPIPARVKVQRLRKKHLLRAALRGTVPDWILDRPKHGFGVPCSDWLRGRLRGYLRSVLLDPAGASARVFDRAELERAIAEHEGGRRDHGFLLYKALNLALWHAAYLGGARNAEPTPLRDPRPPSRRAIAGHPAS
jgi:asparagine synthase (glutamine-hydrolysing)